MSDPRGYRFLLPVFCLLLAAMAVFTEWQVYGTRLFVNYLEGAGAGAGNSCFRLSASLLAAGNRLATRAGIAAPGGLVILRFSQNVLILGLALAWWRRLAISSPRRLIGLLLLAWGLLYAFREGGIDTGVFWATAWALAGIILLGSRRRKFYPLLAFAGAPWSVFTVILPLLPLAGSEGGPKGSPFRGRNGRLALLSIPAWLAGAGIFGNLSGRIWPAAAWGHRPGLDLLIFNLEHSLTWVRVVWLANILPLLALAWLPDWPRRLRRLLPVSLAPAAVALLVYFFPEYRVILVPLAACLIPGFLLLPELAGRAGSRLRKTLRSEWLLIVLLALAALYSQLWVLGGVRGRYLRESQLQRHNAVMGGTARSPWRYQVFSQFLVEGSLRLGRAAGIKTSGPVFSLFRLLQNLLIFYLASRLYRLWGFFPEQRAIGLVLAGWGMTHAFYNSGLAFSTYTDLIIYLLGAAAVAGGKLGWFMPLTVIAALNRETGVLLPALLIPAAGRGGGGRARTLFLASLGVFFAIFFSLRYLLLPGASFVATWGAPGWPRFFKNLSNPLAWRNVFLVVNLLPLAGLLALRRWPGRLREVFLPLIPAWIFLHYYAKACPEETRFLLVPLFLGFVPAVLCLLAGEKPRSAGGLTAPPGAAGGFKP